MTPAPTREQWLTQASAKLAPMIEAHSVTLPALKLSCGWPSRKALSARQRRVGECWSHEATHGAAHVFVSPYLDEPADVLATLLHEMIHAALPMKTGHRGPFVKLTRAVGLEGKPTATVPGEALKARLNALAKALGPYPHSKLTGTLYRKQSTRLRLYECACPVKVRVASDEFAAHCDDCGASFERQD